MTLFEEQLENLKELNPSDEDALFEFLGISQVSPEGYYVSLIYRWKISNESP